MMRKIAIYLFVFICFVSCNKKKKDIEISEKEKIYQEKLEAIFKEQEEKKDTLKPFKEIQNFPEIKDSLAFMKQLRVDFNLDFDLANARPEEHKILNYEKVKLFGSDKDFYIIEYYYTDVSSASFPDKKQYLIDEKGNLIESFWALKYRFVEIFKDKPPFLLATYSTAKGNGWHEIYRFKKDSIINIFRGLNGAYLRTYDTHTDESIIKNEELSFEILDENKDGFNDIVFSGKVLMIMGLIVENDTIWVDGINEEEYTEENPFKTIDVEYVFLYNPKTEMFEPKEAYKMKYLDINDNIIVFD
ncbi:hypothetical protein [Aureivirga sp. CE67]|uniref:hypothetical protein n=1 Tax=Aureivirga sp. CE67 TaxID=1788983 RepID=UPI0018CA3651|nr:hypothetical protein [Aureivirga sp. CE67]